MKPYDLLWSCATLVGAATASNDAYLWTVDAGNTKQVYNQASAISSWTAERIIARRKGASDSQYIDTASQDVISDLNRFGGWQPPLFGAGQSEQPAKVFVRISGFNGAVSDFNTLPDVWIEKPESNLLTTFNSKVDNRNVCEYTIKPRSKDSVSIQYTYFDQTKACLPQSEIESLPAMLALTVTVPTADTVAGKGVSSFHRTLLHLAATENIESTLLILPLASKLKKSTKSELKKRIETPFELPPITADAPFLASNKSSNTTLPKVIPQYFTSKESCDNTTNSCMGHGKCVKTHGNQYRCKCSSTVVRTNDDGTTKSVQWGGNACQKKDISSQFILFATFGIFFLTVVAGAIGMLFSMGSEKLPSVIGAGVVGPRAQR